MTMVKKIENRLMYLPYIYVYLFLGTSPVISWRIWRYRSPGTGLKHSSCDHKSPDAFNGRFHKLNMFHVI